MQRRGTANINVARWAAGFGVQNENVSEPEYRLGRLAIKLLRKREKEHQIEILDKWARIIRGLTQQQDLLHKVKTLNILRWELVVLKLLQSRTSVMARATELWAGRSRGGPVRKPKMSIKVKYAWARLSRKLLKRGARAEKKKKESPASKWGKLIKVLLDGG